MRTIHILLLVFGLCFTSCSSNENVTTAERIEIKSEYKAKVNAVAGDFLEDEVYKPMPIFFNMGNMSLKENKKVETIILSDKLSKGKVINIKPISLLKFRKDTILQNYIISVPTDSTQNVLGIYNYHDLSQEQYQTKFLLEDWFRGNCKLGYCSNFEWQSEVQALKLVD